MLSPWSLLLCLFYLGGSLPSIAFTDSWVFFWAWVLFTCLDLVSVEKEWGQKGDGRSGSEGKNVFSGRSVGFSWLTNQTGRCVLGRCQTAPKTTVPRMCVCERVSLYLCEDILHILLWLKSNFGLLFHCAERVRRQFQNWKEERGTFLVFRGVKHLFRTEDGLPFSSKILYIWRLCV